MVEGPVPEGRGAPIGLPPSDCLLVKFTPPNGRGSALVRECPDDLTFSSTAPGGHESMTCTVDWLPGHPPPDALLTAATAIVVDRRSGQTLWYGQVIDPGWTRTGTGTSHKVACQGFYTILDTEAAAVAYVDRDLSSWVPSNDYSRGSAQVVDDISLGQHSGDWVEPATSVIEEDIPKGAALDSSPNSHLGMQYLPARYGSAGQDLIMVLYSADASSGDANFDIKMLVRNQDNSVVQTVSDYSFTTSVVDSYNYQGDGDWDMTNARSAEMRIEYVGSADETASKDYWLRWGNLAVVFQRLGRTGANAGTPTTYVTSADIVNDVIGRLLLGKLDISAAIAQPTTLIEHAAWFGGISARGIFDFLEDANPNVYWAVWEPDASDLPRFEYVPWAVRPRYVIPPDSAEIALAGGGDDLANRAVVAYQTSKGVPASVIVTGDVPDLDAAGVTRTMIVDLTGEGALSKTTAKSKGLDALKTADVQRSSGTATVFGPVLDMKTGRIIEPWEIRAGWPVVLAGGMLRADGGYPYSRTGARDGRSTFRATQVQYNAATAAAELTLDGGGRNLFNRVRRPLPSTRKQHKDRWWGWATPIRR